MIVMPELRARAQKVVKDRRGWGRYAGVVLEGRMQAGVQRKAAVITVYAPCGTTSAATQRRVAVDDRCHVGVHVLREGLEAVVFLGVGGETLPMAAARIVIADE